MEQTETANPQLGLNTLLCLCREWHEVGSRVTCDPPVCDTDRDILCLVDSTSEFTDQAELDGFRLMGSKVDEDTEDESGRSPFVSMKCGEVNLIATSDREFFGRFMAATRVATRLNLLNKGDRIALFQAVLYGNGQ